MDTNLFGKLVNHARYNLFLVLFPVGNFGEGMMCYLTLKYLQTSEATWSYPYYPLPNKLNISFFYETILLLTVPLFSLTVIPSLFMHLLKQRSKFYKS